MIDFIDGPAAGVALAVRRAPFFLRVVRSPGGEWDALDQLRDEPKPREKMTAYVRVGDAQRVHFRSGKGGVNGWFALARYRVVDRQPSQDEMRSTADWRRWCRAAAGRAAAQARG